MYFSTNERGDVVDQIKTYLKILYRIFANVCVAHDDDTPGEYAGAGRRLKLESVRAIIPPASRLCKWDICHLHRRDNEPIVLDISEDNPPARFVILVVCQPGKRVRLKQQTEGHKGAWAEPRIASGD
jgi:hypothetical protein